jgi:hypothetical protein
LTAAGVRPIFAFLERQEETVMIAELKAKLPALQDRLEKLARYL